MTYRRRIDSKQWHCCRNCPHWPEGRGEYEDRNSKPMSEELCGQRAYQMPEPEPLMTATPRANRASALRLRSQAK